MATRKPKKLTEDHSQVKALNPRDVDQKYLGDEPLFAEQPVSEFRNSAIARGLMWYHRFYSRKDARDMLATYLDFHGRVADGKVMRRVDEGEFKLPTFSWLSRMTLRGLELTEHEMMALENEITRLLDLINKPQTKELSRFTTAAKTVAEVATAKTNIQDTMPIKHATGTAKLFSLPLSNTSVARAISTMREMLSTYLPKKYTGLRLSLMVIPARAYVSPSESYTLAVRMEPLETTVPEER